MIATEMLWIGRIVVVALLLALPSISAAQDAPDEPPAVEERPPAVTKAKPAPGTYTAEDVQALAERVKAMKPKSAGMLLAQLPVGLSAAVLLTLTPRTGGRILNYVPSAQAAAIASEMAGKNTNKEAS